MTPEQLTAAGFLPCDPSPAPYWPGDAFTPLYVRHLPPGPAIYVYCPLERPDDVVAFVGDWARPDHYCEGRFTSIEQLLHQLGLGEPGSPTDLALSQPGRRLERDLSYQLPSRRRH
jgi:hypothetical protein